jgi:hypothetical protein
MMQKIKKKLPGNKCGFLDDEAFTVTNFLSIYFSFFADNSWF